MSTWVAKRFWKEAKPETVECGFTVTLDGRSIKTPAKRDIVLPSLGMAKAMAAEWDAQDEVIDPRTMPNTRSANAAIDKVALQFDEVAGHIAEYGDSDLTCYRAEGPDGLVARQSAAWDALLNWTEQQFTARLIPSAGVMHAPQNPDALKKIANPLFQLSSFQLAAIYDLVTLSGSLVVGWAVFHRFKPTETLWDWSRIDEDWQIEQWGEDEEASELAAEKRRAFLHAEHFLRLSSLR